MKILSQGRRFKAKVAKEIATPNGYCATKKMWFSNHILNLASSSAASRTKALREAAEDDAEIEISELLHSL